MNNKTAPNAQNPAAPIPTNKPLEPKPLEPNDPIEKLAERLEELISARIEVVAPQVIERILARRIEALLPAALGRALENHAKTKAPAKTTYTLITSDPAAPAFLSVFEERLTRREGGIDRRLQGLDEIRNRNLTITPSMLSAGALDELIGILRPNDFGNAFPAEIWAPVIEARRAVG